MGNIQYHSESSARRFGGVAEDYIPIHKLLDSSKLFLADWRHRALLHTTFGVFICETVFGDLFTRASDQVKVCTRTIAEQHIIEDLGCILTPADFLKEMPIKPWMNGVTLAQRRAMQNAVIPDDPDNNAEIAAERAVLLKAIRRSRARSQGNQHEKAQ